MMVEEGRSGLEAVVALDGRFQERIQCREVGADECGLALDDGPYRVGHQLLSAPEVIFAGAVLDRLRKADDGGGKGEEAKHVEERESNWRDGKLDQLTTLQNVGTIFSVRLTSLLTCDVQSSEERNGKSENCNVNGRLNGSIGNVQLVARMDEVRPASAEVVRIPERSSRFVSKAGGLDNVSRYLAHLPSSHNQQRGGNSQQ